MEFSPNNDVIYSIFKPLDDDEKKEQDLSTVFRTIDAVSYELISTIDAEHNLSDIALDSRDRYVSLLVNQSDDSSVVRLYDIGRSKLDEEVEEDEEERAAQEEEEEEDEDEDDDDMIYDDDEDGMLLDIPEDELAEFQDYFADDSALDPDMDDDEEEEDGH
jgi:hypothetical protein